MSKQVSVKLTDEQRRQIKEATGKDAVEVTLEAQELEERVAPMMANASVRFIP